MPQPLEGKVAAILNESVLIVNLGAEAGVSEGMVFVVVASGKDVKDPDTGASLGAWEIPKGRVRVLHVQPRLATCGALDPHGAAKSGAGATLSTVMLDDSLRSRDAGGAKLNVRRADVLGLPEIGPIQVGDRVRQVVGKE